MSPSAEGHEPTVTALYGVSRALSSFVGAERSFPAIFAALGDAVPVSLCVLVEDVGPEPIIHVGKLDQVDSDRVAQSVAAARARHALGAARSEAVLRDATGLSGDELCFPLTHAGHRVGLLQVETVTGADAPARRFFEWVCEQLALAIGRDRALNEVQDAVRSRDHALSVVAHDLGNALNTILLTTEMALEVLPEVERRAFGNKSFRSIRRSGQLMHRLVRDLLDTTSINVDHLAMDCRSTAFGPLIKDVLEQLRFLAEPKNILLEEAIEDDLPVVFVDADRLRQVLHNLIGNAIKFTPRSGRILVRASAEADHVLCSVSDTGPGIRAEDQAHIFERFWQDRPASNLGAGLGLPIARSLVEALGGRLWIDAAHQPGARFCFELPRDASAVRDRERARVGAAATSRVTS